MPITYVGPFHFQCCLLLGLPSANSYINHVQLYIIMRYVHKKNMYNMWRVASVGRPSVQRGDVSTSSNASKAAIKAAGFVEIDVLRPSSLFKPKSLCWADCHRTDWGTQLKNQRKLQNLLLPLFAVPPTHISDAFRHDKLYCPCFYSSA